MAAVLSECGSYRYRLERQVSLFGDVGVFIMVNPSTADASVDDPTVRRVTGFAREFGWSRLIVANLFAYRTPRVVELAKVIDPVGPENDKHLRCVMSEAQSIVVAWGTIQKLPFALRDHWRDIVAIADSLGKPLHCLGTASDGHPRHPLMLRKTSQLVAWDHSTLRSHS